MGILAQLSDDLSTTVENVSSGVVRVEARQRMPASGIAWSGDLIVTAHHVIERDDNITVGLPSGETVSAELVGRDPSRDVAVLRVEGANLESLSRSAPDSVKVGHLVLGIGRPGKGVRATLGMVNAIGNEWRTPSGGKVDSYLHTGIAMYPGFSGGPLVDVSGGVVGLNTSALLRGTASTITVPTLESIVESITTHGRVRRGYLGVGAQPVRLQETIAKQANQETGLLVASVEPDSPADEAGVLVGDTIISLGGDAVTHLDSLFASLAEERVGVSVPVQIVRGGNLQVVPVTVGERS